MSRLASRTALVAAACYTAFYFAWSLLARSDLAFADAWFNVAFCTNPLIIGAAYVLSGNAAGGWALYFGGAAVSFALAASAAEVAVRMRTAFAWLLVIPGIALLLDFLIWLTTELVSTAHHV